MLNKNSIQRIKKKKYERKCEKRLVVLGVMGEELRGMSEEMMQRQIQNRSL